MSVLACERNQCSNVMCDYFILNRYICSDCLFELREEMKNWNQIMSRSEMHEKIEEFFLSEVGYDYTLVDISEEFDKILKRN